MEMIAFEIEIVKKKYNDQQLYLINIWNEYLKTDRIGYILLVKKAGRPTKIGIRRINGIKTEFVRYVNDKKEMVKIDEINFILLMAKCGVEVKFNEK